MLHLIFIPLLAGLLVGVNPYNARSLRARLAEHANAPRRVPVEAALLTLAITLLVATLSWRFAAFIGGRLTNSLLLLGFFVLAGAFYSLLPYRRREPAPVPTGWRWLASHASDIIYYAGPAWMVATALAMQQLTFPTFILTYLAAAAGLIIATAAWTTRYAGALPEAPKRADGTRPRAMLLLGLAYGASAVIMFAANLKLL